MNHNDFAERRNSLTDSLPGAPVLLFSGCDRYRNYPSYPFPFRASSHYLFFGGPNKPGHFLLIQEGEAVLFRPGPDPDDEVWHGPSEPESALLSRFGLKSVKTIGDLEETIAVLGKERVLSIPSPDSRTNERLKSLLDRVPSLDSAPDAPLVEAVMELRGCQDEAAQEAIREAVSASIELQKTVLGQCAPGVTERELRGALDQKTAAEGWSVSFQPIISVAGEVLHNPYYKNTLSEGDLLLVDCGAEISNGYVGDLTRTVPVSGRFSPTQKAIYDIVDAARAKGVSMVGPGVHFADIHREASLVIAEGLVEIGILKGDPEELVDKGVHALFFCHGLGHLMGLDAHDMEDFGDRIGYEKGTQRSKQFGLSNLRLSRLLEPGMVVTIEPGYYHIPALLESELGRGFASFVDRDVLAQYGDVRGIRIEDNVLVTESGRENLSSELPTSSDEVVGLVGSALALKA